MAIDLDSGTGLFDRWGKILHALNEFNDHIGGSVAGDLPTEINDALVEFDGASNDFRHTADAVLAALGRLQDTNASDMRQALQQWAENTLIEMADADNPLPAKTAVFALDELIRQMEETSETVDANEPTISSVVNGPLNQAITGATQANPVVITSNAHGLENGDIVSIADVGGMTEINDREFTIRNVATNTFELQDENGTAHTAYTSGGLWRSCAGNGQVITSLLAGDGTKLENALQEDVILKASSNATRGSEIWAVHGERNLAVDRLHHKWPSGSGVTTSMTTIDPDSTGTLLTNGGFENITSNVPDNWSLEVGTAGQDIFEETTNIYRGSKSIRFQGGTSILTQIRQQITPKARTPYPVQLRCNLNIITASGTVLVDLFDGTNVIEDDQGVANSFQIDMIDLGTAYTNKTGVFRLPDPVPTTVYFRIRVSVAIPVGGQFFFDDAVIGPAMTQVYQGGPYVSYIRGSKDVAVNDEFRVPVINDQRGEFQKGVHRLFGLPHKVIPSATSGETIADTLIG